MITLNYLLPISKIWQKLLLQPVLIQHLQTLWGELNPHEALTVQDKGTHYIDQSSMVLTLRLDQPHCRRGRPKKTTTVETCAEKESAPAEAVAHKQARNDTSTDSRENEPAKKRTKEAGHDENSPPSPQTKGKWGCKATTVPPRDQLPDCPGRNINPVPKTTTKCTPEEAKAKWEAKVREIERRIQELEAAKQLLAQANVAEDVGISSDYPTRLSTALRKRGCPESNGEGGEDFDFKEADEMFILSDGKKSGEIWVSFCDCQHWRVYWPQTSPKKGGEQQNGPCAKRFVT